jgi:hypothetical protein
MLSMPLDAGPRWKLPVSELDETTALPSRNLHINEFSELSKHVPQVFVAHGWIEPSHKYLPTHPIHTAHHSDTQFFPIPKHLHELCKQILPLTIHFHFTSTQWLPFDGDGEFLRLLGLLFAMAL